MNRQEVNESALPVLANETVINVAALLQEEVGARRMYELQMSHMPLADDIVAERLDGQVTLTHLRGQILGSFVLAGTAIMECVRCLRPYSEPVSTTFAESFRQHVDVRTGTELHPSDQLDPEEDDDFPISENHEIDIREAIRQNVLISLPMRPDCGEDCPGPDLQLLATANADDGDDDEGSGQFSALSALLDDQHASDQSIRSVDPFAGGTETSPE